jgi:hypothetical protein
LLGEQPDKYPVIAYDMARPIIEVEMLPVGKTKDALCERKSETKKDVDVDACQSETEDLIRMLQEALDLKDDDTEKKPPARSRPMSARSSTSSTSSSRVINRNTSSLSAEAVRKIEKENARLLQRITETAGKRRVAGTCPASNSRVETHSMVNRRRADERIRRENAVFDSLIHSFIHSFIHCSFQLQCLSGAVTTNSVCKAKSFR